MIVIFAGGIVLFMLLLAVVVDVSWYWANTLRVQRAADAAALAGVVWLPDCPASTLACPDPKNARVHGEGRGQEERLRGRSQRDDDRDVEATRTTTAV